MKRIKTIFTYKKLQKIEKNRQSSIIPPKTFTTSLEKVDHPDLHEMLEEIRAGKEVHSPCDAPTGISQRRRELKEWTKKQSTNVPSHILSHVNKDAEKFEEKKRSNWEKKSSRKFKKAV